MSRHAFWRSLAAAILISSATPAFAQGSAEALFKEGVAAAEAGKVDLAYEKLAAAWQLKQTYDIAGNLGVIEKALGKHRDAAEHVDFAIRNLPASAEASARADLTVVLNELKRKIATLEISAPAGATIELDGKSIGTAPLSSDVFVEPGKHVLLGKQAGKVDGKLDFEVAAGESKTVQVELGAAPVAAPPKVEEDNSAAMWPAYTGFGVAAAGIGVGIAGFVLSEGARSDTEDMVAAIAAGNERCVEGNSQPTAQCADAVSSFHTFQDFQILGIAGMAVGGAALTFAVVYMLIPDDSSASGPNKEAQKPKAALTPWFSPDGGGFAVSGLF